MSTVSQSFTDQHFKPAEFDKETLKYLLGIKGSGQFERHVVMQKKRKRECF